MITLIEAIKKDIEVATIFYPPYQKLGPKIIAEAADAYEAYLGSNEGQENPWEASINLSNFYWQILNPGFSQEIDKDLYKKAETMYVKILDQVVIKKPSSVEICFWKKYYSFIDSGTGFTPEECELLIQEEKGILVPYFFLFSSAEGKKYNDEANKLLKMCINLPTMKNSYIKSVIESSAF